MDGFGDLEAVVQRKQANGGLNVRVIKNFRGDMIESPWGPPRCCCRSVFPVQSSLAFTLTDMTNLSV